MSITTPVPVARRGLATGILIVAAFMDLVDVTIVNVALPAIRGDLDATPAHLEWILSGYTLAFAVLLITGGRLGDNLGRRTMFLVGVAGFTPHRWPRACPAAARCCSSAGSCRARSRR